jgi:hypothetical protein
MGRKERRRRRAIFKGLAYTAGAAALGYGTYYLSKKLMGGQIKKGTEESVTDDTAPEYNEEGSGFSEYSEAGVVPSGGGLFGGTPILGMPPVVLIGIAAGAFLLFRKR